MPLTLSRSGANSCDWLYRNDVVLSPPPLWPPTPIPALTQVEFAQLARGRLKTLLTKKYEAVGGKSAGMVFFEAAMEEGLFGKLSGASENEDVSFRLDVNGFPSAVWAVFAAANNEYYVIHIGLAHSTSE